MRVCTPLNTISEYLQYTASGITCFQTPAENSKPACMAGYATGSPLVISVQWNRGSHCSPSAREHYGCLDGLTRTGHRAGMNWRYGTVTLSRGIRRFDDHVLPEQWIYFHTSTGLCDSPARCANVL